MSPASPIATFNRMAADSELSLRYGTHTIVQVVAGLAAAFAIAGGGFTVTNRSVSPGCNPITYTFVGSPPAHAVSQFELATAEIHQHSGIVFEDSTPDASALTVRWSDGVATGASPLISGGSPERALGFASSVWRGGRELVTATIEVDATASWPAGMSESDGLAVVFVHELGHVVGLDHSPEASSFMYEHMSHEGRHWTGGDREGLAEAGRQLGCAVPQADD